MLLGLLGVRPTRRPETTPASSNRGAHLPPKALRCSAAPDGTGNQNLNSKSATLVPFALTEYRSQSGIKARTCLSVASCARPRSGEERKGSAQPMSAPGAVLFGYFRSWASKRKYLAQRAKQQLTSLIAAASHSCSRLIISFCPKERGTFLCFAKEKYPKERRTRRLARYAGPLRFSDFWAFAQLAGRKHPRPAQTGRLTYPQKPCDARLRPREPGKVFLTPSVQPSTAGKTGASAPPVRARSERSEIGELGARRFFRGAQGTPRHTAGVPRGQPPDRFSFGSFSLAGQRKLTRPSRAKPTNKKRTHRGLERRNKNHLNNRGPRFGAPSR